MNENYPRILPIEDLIRKKSFFLFGPRSTGKTTLIREKLSEAHVYDLLNAKTFQRLLKNPTLLEEENTAESVVVIDEIQKLPQLLDEVHRLIESKKIRFLLTGSSARKLKHGSSNLLAGRARSAELFPLTIKELLQKEKSFDILRYLNFGGLPQVYTSEEPLEELESYVGTYLQEEIKAEAVTRHIQSFAEFLDIIGQSSGQEINYVSLASDCQVTVSTFKNYLQILDDTLLGFSLSAFTKTKKRKAQTRSKYYLFDIGVRNFLAQSFDIRVKSPEFGNVFEHFIVLEVRAYISYMRTKSKMSYWKSTSQFEVDLLIDQTWAIEIKGVEMVLDKHLKGLRVLKEENIFEKYLVVSCDERYRETSDGISIVPWKDFVLNLWTQGYF